MKQNWASNYRENQAQDVELPSGVTVRLRKPTRQFWLKRQRLPQNLLQIAIAARNAAQPEELKQKFVEAFAQSTEAEQKSIIQFLCEVVEYAFVLPRLVEHPISDDELSTDELSEEDFNFVLAWATRTAPNAQVPLNGGGDATVKEVATFHPI